ncbi:MAG TPA: epoxide hydrolase N-terminal domain-containing protein [Terriglobales bacterium]|nr:epoxide hydrolase N-terminal domain-containing protein [Terriglobales bacterium]
MALAPFSIPSFEPKLAGLRARLRQTRWPHEPAGAAWDYGFDGAARRALCAYRRNRFDWAAQAARMAAFPTAAFPKPRRSAYGPPSPRGAKIPTR